MGWVTFGCVLSRSGKHYYSSSNLTVDAKNPWFVVPIEAFAWVFKHVQNISLLKAVLCMTWLRLCLRNVKGLRTVEIKELEGCFSQC